MAAHRWPFDGHSSYLSLVDPGDAGTITVDRNPAYVPLVSAGAETRTLAIPTVAGVSVTIAGRTVAGTITLTVTSGYNEDGDTSFSITAAGQHVEFVAVEDGSNLRWRLRASYLTANVANAVDGVAAGYKIARGQLTTVTAADTVVTGLTTVVSVVATLDDDPGDDPMLVSATIGDQAGTPAAGSVIIKTWQNTTGTDPTPVAAATFSKKVNWIAIGT